MGDAVLDDATGAGAVVSGGRVLDVVRAVGSLVADDVVVDDCAGRGVLPAGSDVELTKVDSGSDTRRVVSVLTADRDVLVARVRVADAVVVMVG
ncbi:MAG: hypothetical protein ACRCTR_08370 [Actinomycetota bacterium]